MEERGRKREKERLNRDGDTKREGVREGERRENEREIFSQIHNPLQMLNLYMGI